MPMMSKMIPIRMMTIRIRKAAKILLLCITSSEMKEMVPDTTMVTKKMVTTQRIALYLFFFKAAESVFDTEINPFEIFNKRRQQTG